ncbi:50S ribosomal protein L25 [bacterium]|nr:50S ribosomal protein L25 [bacterium]
MAETALNVEWRGKPGMPGPKSIRRAGKVPAVFYGHHEESVSISLDGRELDRVLHSKANILDAKFPDGKVKKCIIRDIQRDPVTDAFVHVDIMGIQLTEKIRLTIPVISKGIPEGVKTAGGILEHPLREIEVEGLPMDIPDAVEIDVQALNIGDAVTVSDLKAEKIRFLADPHQTLAHVVIAKGPKLEAEAEVPAEAEGAEEAGKEEGKEAKEGKEGKEGKEAKETKEGKEGKPAKEGKSGKPGSGKS